MAYVEWHQEIHNHHKTLHLMRLLGLPKYAALGIIGAISSWAVGHRPGGIFEKKLVAIAVEWDKDPDLLLNALLESGWLEEFDKTKIEIHDWEEITKGYRRARKDAKRKNDEREEVRRLAAQAAKKGKKSSAVNPKDSPQRVRGQKRPQRVRGQSDDRRAEQTRTERTERTEQTRPDPSLPRSTVLQQPQNHPSAGSSGGTTGPEGGPVVAVPDGKRPDLPQKQDPQAEHDVTERLLKQVSIRLSTPILEALGVDGGMAEKLAKAYPAVRILHVAEHAKGQENPGGFARTALEKGWTVPESNGAGLANMLKALEAELLARDKAWDKMAGGGILKKDPEFERLPGETTEEHLRRVDGLMKKRKEGGK